MIPRLGEPVSPRHVYRPRHGVYAALTLGRRALLTYQGAPHDEFQLPGGGIDPGEHPLAALHREVREETGWAIRPIRKLGVFRRFAFMPEYDGAFEKICHVYHARPVRRLGPPTEADHVPVWMPLEMAAEAIGPAGGRMFLDRGLA